MVGERGLDRRTRQKPKDEVEVAAPRTARPPPRWTSDEEASLRTIVGELRTQTPINVYSTGEKWKTIAERLGTGRTGHAVEIKWAKLKAAEAAKNATAPPPVVPAPAPVVIELWGDNVAEATRRVIAVCEPQEADAWNKREPEADEDAKGGEANKIVREAFLAKIARPGFVNAADRVLGPGAAARGWKVEERHNCPRPCANSGFFKEPRYSYACPDRKIVKNRSLGTSRRDLLHFYKHWKPAREAVHMNSSSTPRVGGPEVIDAHRTRIRKSVVADPAGVFDRLRRKIEVVDEVRGPLAGIFLRIFAVRQEWITRPGIEFDVVTPGIMSRLPAFLRSSRREAVSTATSPWRWLSAHRALEGVRGGAQSLRRWFALTTATGGGGARRSS